jgi:hypothetical protein
VSVLPKYGETDKPMVGATGKPLACDTEDDCCDVPQYEIVECGACPDDEAPDFWTVTIPSMTNAMGGQCDCPGIAGVYELPFIGETVLGDTTQCKWELTGDGDSDPIFPDCTGMAGPDNQQIELLLTKTGASTYAASLTIFQGGNTVARWASSGSSPYACLTSFSLSPDTSPQCTNGSSASLVAGVFP